MTVREVFVVGTGNEVFFTHDAFTQLLIENYIDISYMREWYLVVVVVVTV